MRKLFICMLLGCAVTFINPLSAEAADTHIPNVSSGISQTLMSYQSIADISKNDVQTVSSGVCGIGVSYKQYEDVVKISSTTETETKNSDNDKNQEIQENQEKTNDTENQGGNVETDTEDNASNESMQNTVENVIAEQPVTVYPVYGNGRTFSALSEDEFNLLCRLVSAEAGPNSWSAGKMVAEVVLNRVDSGVFPNDVASVIYQNNNGEYQFSPVLDGNLYSAQITDTVISCVKDAMQNPSCPHSLLYFRSGYYHTGFGTPYTECGGLYFSVQ